MRRRGLGGRLVGDRERGGARCGGDDRGIRRDGLLRPGRRDRRSGRQALAELEGNDPSVAEAFRQIADELRAIKAPDEIATDWNALTSGLDRLSESFADFDVTDPESLAAMEQAEGDLSEASANVEIYLRDECGIEP
ncbi:MAG: hypothetical protein ABWY29_10355 [Blastococcus sp.]